MYGQLKTLQPNADKRERANNFGGRNNLEIGFASLIADFTLIQSIEFHFQYIRYISRHTNTIKRTKREREKKKTCSQRNLFERSVVHFQFQCLRNFILRCCNEARKNVRQKSVTS